MLRLNSYACNPYESKGRLISEEPTLLRNNFQLDRDRIINSNAFRRLEYKTQVFINYEGDHYRTRLTHSIEVAAIAKTLARNLGLNEDLAETIALAHDMGHSPFGHAGEEGLQECMEDYGGFCHNSHSIKLLTHLETGYAKFKGLNLSWETLEGIAKHNGPITENIHYYLNEYNQIYDLALDKFPSLEAQVASIADDITYHSHDLEDGIRAGLLKIEDLREIDLLQNIIKDISATYQGLSFELVVYESLRKLKHCLINDLVAISSNNLMENEINTPEDARNASKFLINFSPKIASENSLIKQLLFDKLYKNHKMILMKLKAKKVVKSLFKLYFETPESMPPEWQNFIKKESDTSKARVVCDYIAGMTDRYAVGQYEAYFNLTSNKYF